KSEGKICKQPHVALVAWTGRGHRECIRQEAIVVRLAKQIASEQLPRVGCSLHTFHNVRQHLSLAFHFVRTARVFEMRFSTSVREKYQAEDKCRPKHENDDPNAAQARNCAFEHEGAEESVASGAANQTALIPEDR